MNVSFPKSDWCVVGSIVERYMDKMSLFLLPDGFTTLFSFHHFIFIKLFFCICNGWTKLHSVICIIYSFYRSFDPVIPKLININTALIYSESTSHRNIELTPAHAVCSSGHLASRHENINNAIAMDASCISTRNEISTVKPQFYISRYLNVY